MATLNGELANWVGLKDPARLDHLVAGAAFLLYRLLGLFVLPLFWCMPRWRNHIWRVPCPSPGRTWVVGASIGEQAVARALGPLLSEGYWPTSLSARSPAAGAFPAPLDLPFVVETFFRRARPGRIILVEGELWPGYLVAARRRGIPVVLVQAQKRRGLLRWGRSGPLGRVWLQGVGVRAVGEWGDLKRFGSAEGDLRCVGGSVVLVSARSGDTARLIRALSLTGWPTEGPLAGRAVLIAPRHSADVDDAVAVFTGLQIPLARRSSGSKPGDGVFLLDSIGELDGCLAGAGVAVIGGTWERALGGHSPAAALAAGVPVVHGPFTFANAAAYAPLELCVQSDDDTPAGLARALVRGLSLRVVRTSREDLPDRRSALVASLPGPRAPSAEPLYPWMVPFQRLWAGLVRLDRWRKGPSQRVGGVPVVSIGALSAGGSGKTQLVVYLATRIPGAWVVSRGFGRRPGPPVRVGLPGDANLSEGWLGDEAEMVRRRGVPVVTARQRERAIAAAIGAGARVVLVDDGFQSWGVHRDLDLVCVDGVWPDGGGLIPGGWLREDQSALARAGGICVVFPADHHAAQEPLSLPSGIPMVRAVVRPSAWRYRGERLPLGAVRGGVRAAVGIAHPGRFLELLQSLGLRVRLGEVVRDHGQFAGDLHEVVMTEKDAARLPADAPVWALEVALEVESERILRDLLAQVGVVWPA